MGRHDATAQKRRRGAGRRSNAKRFLQPGHHEPKPRQAASPDALSAMSSTTRTDGSSPAEATVATTRSDNWSDAFRGLVRGDHDGRRQSYDSV
jgi:hypothetical protein